MKTNPVKWQTLHYAKVLQKKAKEKAKISQTFEEYFEVTREQLSELWEVFMEYGMTAGEAPHRSKGNHYFLQGICQYHSVEWQTWHKKLTPFVKNLIETKYPQFMVEDKFFEK